jgi:hypothetical protein
MGAWLGGAGHNSRTHSVTKQLITRAVLTAVYDIYQSDPDIYLDKLFFWLAIHHDIAISK